ARHADRRSLGRRYARGDRTRLPGPRSRRRLRGRHRLLETLGRSRFLPAGTAGSGGCDSLGGRSPIAPDRVARTPSHSPRTVALMPRASKEDRYKEAAKRIQSWLDADDNSDLLVLEEIRTHLRLNPIALRKDHVPPPR